MSLICLTIDSDALVQALSDFKDLGLTQKPNVRAYLNGIEQIINRPSLKGDLLQLQMFCYVLEAFLYRAVVVANGGEPPDDMLQALRRQANDAAKEAVPDLIITHRN